jgi:hypothetical protein
MVSVALAVSGCGRGGDDVRGAHSADDLRRAHSAYIDAWIGHDAEGFCAYLAPDLHRRIAESGRTCVTRITELFGKYGAARGARYPPLGEIRISGDTARARYAIKGSPPIAFEWVGGVWFVSGAPELSREPLEGMPTMPSTAHSSRQP